jgi:predicted SnoaL-like aldol condensation-catalyzing enzyme
MGTRNWIIVGTVIVMMWACTAEAQGADNADAIRPVSDMKLPAGQFPFLTNQNLPFAQTNGNWLPPVSAEQLEKNKRLVLRFYGGDRSVLADDFIQHDPGEPSTRVAWTEFMKHRMEGKGPRPSVGGKPGYGDTARDSRGKPVNSMIAEGDIVVAVRQRDWDWSGGPEPVFKGIFVDIWRVQNDKLAEQWCSCTPSDAAIDLIQRAKDQGYWKK